MRAPKPALKREALSDLTAADLHQGAGGATGLLSCAPTMETCTCGATNTCGCGWTQTCGCGLTNTCTCGGAGGGTAHCDMGLQLC